MSLVVFVIIAVGAGLLVGALLGSNKYLVDALVAVFGAWVCTFVLKAFGVSFDFQLGSYLFPAIGGAASVGLVRAI